MFSIFIEKTEQELFTKQKKEVIFEKYLCRKNDELKKLKGESL